MTRILTGLINCVYVAILGLYSTATFAAAACDISALTVLATDNFKIVSAELNRNNKVPYCDVEARMQTTNNVIRVRVGLPESWNGKFLFEATGGGAGLLVDVGPAVGRGYASVTTDTGHIGFVSDMSFWLNDEQRTDWIHRAVHTATIGAKAFVESYYSQAISASYLRGCSNGGRAGLMEAQRYPDDYDGIISGAPAANVGLIALNWIWNAQVLRKTPLSTRDWSLVGKAVLDECDQRDGLSDGIIQDDRRCELPLAQLRCTAENSKKCLSTEKLQAVQHIWHKPILADGSTMLLESRGYEHEFSSQLFYAGVSRMELLKLAVQSWNSPRGGFEVSAIEPSLPIGVVLPFFLKGVPSVLEQIANDFSKGILLPPTRRLDIGEFDVVKNGPELAKQLNAIVDVTHNPDLTAYLNRGSKLLLWHGLADKTLPPSVTYRYFNDAREHAMEHGYSASAFDQAVTLYTAPTIAHCLGGSGPDTGDLLSVLDDWVSKGIQPGPVKVVKKSSEAKISRSRLICPMPYEPRYKGQRSINEASSFSCEIPMDRVGVNGISTSLQTN